MPKQPKNEKRGKKKKAAATATDMGRIIFLYT